MTGRTGLSLNWFPRPEAQKGMERGRSPPMPVPRRNRGAGPSNTGPGALWGSGIGAQCSIQRPMQPWTRYDYARSQVNITEDYKYNSYNIEIVGKHMPGQLKLCSCSKPHTMLGPYRTCIMKTRRLLCGMLTSVKGHVRLTMLGVIPRIQDHTCEAIQSIKLLHVDEICVSRLEC